MNERRRGNILHSNGWLQGGIHVKTCLTHVVFSSCYEAERLRKQWEEEEEERLKQMSVPAEPKSKRLL